MSQPEPTAAKRADVPLLIAHARVVQSEMAWLGGFLETSIPERPDLPKRTDRAYRLLDEVIATLGGKP